MQPPSLDTKPPSSDSPQLTQAAYRRACCPSAFTLRALLHPSLEPSAGMFRLNQLNRVADRQQGRGLCSWRGARSEALGHGTGSSQPPPLRPGRAAPWRPRLCSCYTAAPVSSCPRRASWLPCEPARALGAAVRGQAWRLPALL